MGDKQLLNLIDREAIRPHCMYPLGNGSVVSGAFILAVTGMGSGGELNPQETLAIRLHSQGKKTEATYIVDLLKRGG